MENDRHFKLIYTNYTHNNNNDNDDYDDDNDDVMLELTKPVSKTNRCFRHQNISSIILFNKNVDEMFVVKIFFSSFI